MGEEALFQGIPDELLRWIGILVIAIFFLFKDELKTVFRKKNGTAALIALEEKKCFKEAMEKIEDLHEWHDHDMPGHPGVKNWWTDSELPRSIDGLKTAIEKLSVKVEALNGRAK